MPFCLPTWCRCSSLWDFSFASQTFLSTGGGSPTSIPCGEISLLCLHVHLRQAGHSLLAFSMPH